MFTVAGHAVEAAPAETPGAGTVVPLAVALTPADLAVRVVSVEAEPATPVPTT